MKTRNKGKGRSLRFLGRLGQVLHSNYACLGCADMWDARFCAFPAFTHQVEIRAWDGRKHAQ